MKREEEAEEEEEEAEREPEAKAKGLAQKRRGEARRRMDAMDWPVWLVAEAPEPAQAEAKQQRRT